MKKMMIGTFLALASQLSFAQSTEKVEIGARASQFVNSNISTSGVGLSFKSKGGLYIPVKYEIGKDLRVAAMGLGYKSDAELSKVFSFSIAAAVQNMKFNEDIDYLVENDKERFVTILQNEVNFQLSNRLALGVNFDVDLFNGSKVESARHLRAKENFIAAGYYEETNKAGEVSYHRDTVGSYVLYQSDFDFETKKEHEDNMASIKKASGTAFGVSLKFRINK